ncbi:unnamed protein product [Calicophoron daubneyi]|uniref:Uncharacterized protein n=1 Tax=Calicophoron daubneyi TaxID=300641 RepID=A0AAV2TJE6_CALDB
MSVASENLSSVPVQRTLTKAVVSNVYGYSSNTGYTSPTLLYSPAPVRSGKTPLSPVAPLETPNAFASEIDDEDNCGSADESYPVNSNRTVTPSASLFEIRNVRFMNLPGHVSRQPETAGKIDRNLTDFQRESVVAFSDGGIESNPLERYCRSECPSFSFLSPPKRFVPNHCTKSLSVFEFCRIIPDEDEIASRLPAEPPSLFEDLAAQTKVRSAVLVDEPADDLSVASQQ